MFTLKRFFTLIIASFVVIMAVNAQSGSEMSVEESYIQETIELMIIRETARASTREQKYVALDYIADAIERGSKNDDIRQTLEFLSREGRRTIATENGRVVNNFPDVRRQSARYLGQMGTEEARKTLLDICQFENEPMVLQEAIKSLGDIGVIENDDAIVIISWIVARFDNLNPDNLMALATIDAFESFARKNNGISSPEAVRTLVRITEGHYITPVKERARELLAELRSYADN
jgi:HEAT repeat protein